LTNTPALELLQEPIMDENHALPSLQGIRVALTVAAEDQFALAGELESREANLIYYPVSQTLPPDSFDDLDQALQRCQQGEIHWLLFTTPCAVEAVAARLAQLEVAPVEFAQVRIGAYGAKTHLTLAELFPTWQNALPHVNSHAEMIEAMRLNEGERVLLPVAQRSRADWRNLIDATGAEAIPAPAYRLLLGRSGEDLPGLLWGGLVDAIVFLTENSVRHFVVRLKAEGGSLDMLGDVVVACLDPQTASAARAYHLSVQVVAESYTPSDLAETLAQYFDEIMVNS
jgi:uroporphyrinogen III methyltransferase / synthase